MKGTPAGLARNLSLRSLRVWQRNADVYLVTWKTNVVPPLLEPILYLVAFGMGIGALVNQVVYRGQPIGYTAFIAPGLLATQVMFQAFFENTFNTFVRMYYQRPSTPSSQHRSPSRTSWRGSCCGRHQGDDRLHDHDGGDLLLRAAALSRRPGHRAFSFLAGCSSPAPASASPASCRRSTRSISRSSCW